MLLSEISPVEMTYLGKIDHQCFTQGRYREMFQDVCDLGPAFQEEGVGSGSVVLESLAHGVPGELSFFKVGKQQRLPPKCATLWHSLQPSL